MARTDISICSRALMNLGARPINSFNTPGDVPDFLRVAYPEIRAQIIASYQWECMKVRAELTREAVIPSGFAWQFLAPGDMFGAPIAAYPSEQPGTRTTSAFEVRSGKILANDQRLWLEYTAIRPEAVWPAWFAELVMSAVAAEIAYMVTDQQSVKDYWEAKTYGTPSENRIGGLMGQAMTLDAQGSGNNPGMADNAFIDARFGAIFPGEAF